jgi:hypothetical protein
VRVRCSASAPTDRINEDRDRALVQEPRTQPPDLLAPELARSSSAPAALSAPIASGAIPKVIQKKMGHVTIQMTTSTGT